MASQPPATDITSVSIGGVRLEPTSPTWSAVFGLLRGLTAALGVMATIWSFVPTRNLAGLYAYFHTSDFAGFVAWLVAVVCLGWGFWKKYRGKSTENTLKAAVVTQHETIQAVADNIGTTPAALVAATQPPVDAAATVTNTRQGTGS